jgi:hypothetical protein
MIALQTAARPLVREGALHEKKEEELVRLKKI